MIDIFKILSGANVIGNAKSKVLSGKKMQKTLEGLGIMAQDPLSEMVEYLSSRSGDLSDNFTCEVVATQDNHYYLSEVTHLLKYAKFIELDIESADFALQNGVEIHPDDVIVVTNKINDEITFRRAIEFKVFIGRDGHWKARWIVAEL